MPNEVEPLTPALGLSVPRVRGVTESEYQTVRSLWDVWIRKLPRNQLRTVYYDGEAPFRDLGISIPPGLRTLGVVIGWPEKAVQTLADRNIWDGFVAAGQPDDPFDLSDVLTDNRFDVELPQAIVSAYKHSCAFISTTIGDVQSGEPEVLVMSRSAEWSSALWDRNRRALQAALAVTDTDEQGTPTGFIVYLPYAVLICSRGDGGLWSVDRRPNPLGVVPVEALTYDPQLDRPFGRSRITREVMDITDRAARTVLRTEVGAEFYSAPQRYILGADPDSFGSMDKWQATLGRMLGLTRDEDGNLPEIGQFAQQSMEPHLAQLRQLAAQFSGATGVPLNSLGIVQDNPASAEAIYATREDLIVRAGAQNRIFGSALSRTAQHVVMIRDGLDVASPELKRLRARWANPAFPSPASSADAFVKLAAVLPELAQTDVGLEMAGLTDSQITRLSSERRRIQSNALVQALTQAAQPAAPAAPVVPVADADNAG